MQYIYCIPPDDEVYRGRYHVLEKIRLLQVIQQKPHTLGIGKEKKLNHVLEFKTYVSNELFSVI